MQPPIFILSSPRSGSTLLRYVLDTHPEIYAPPELSLGPLSRMLAVALGGLRGVMPATPPSGADSPEILARVRGEIRRLMDEHTAERRKSIWCEKSPKNLGCAELLVSLFPEARYVCLYRNHMDTLESCLDSSRYVVMPVLADHFGSNPRMPVHAVLDFWLDSTEKLLALERSASVRTHRIRYEDLVRRPAEALAPLFSFLGLDFDPGLVDEVYRTPHDVGLGDTSASLDRKIHCDSVGRGRNFPNEMATAAQLARLAAVNRELGYDELLREILGAPPPAAGARDEAPPADGRGARWVFEELLPARLAERGAELAPLQRSYRFEVYGEGGGSWVLHRDGSGDLAVLGDGQPDGAASTVFGLGAADLLALVEGRQHVLRLQREGRLTLAGESLGLDQVQALVALFRAGA